MVDDNIGICYSLGLGNIRYVGWVHEEHCVRLFLSSFVIASAHVAEVLAKCQHSGLLSGRIIQELFVVCGGFSCSWMYHRHSKVLKVDIGCSWQHEFEWGKNGCVIL
jgi:hypothetical protein